MTDKTQYLVKKEPYYQSQGNEVALYEAAYRNRLPVMVKGPTGCGKSRFVEYMAWKLGKPLITVACNEDMTASDLVGRFLLDAGSGPVQYDEYLTYSQDYRYRVCMDLSVVALQEARKRLGEKGIYVYDIGTGKQTLVT